MRKCRTQKDTETLVHALVTSKLDNCNSLLAELPQYLLDRVQRVQNAAAHFFSCTRKYDRITPVLKELHWRLPVKQWLIFKMLLFTYKALTALAPQYISDLLAQYKRPPRALRSSVKKLLQVPHFKLDLQRQIVKLYSSISVEPASKRHTARIIACDISIQPEDSFV